jgi:putative ABC transport system substrate-binding protein
MGRARAQALFMFFAPFFTVNRSRLLELAAQGRLPGMYEFRSYVEGGGLMSYDVDNAHLKGGKLADFSVELLMKVELVINLKTAKVLGLTKSPTLFF